MFSMKVNWNITELERVEETQCLLYHYKFFFQVVQVGGLGEKLEITYLSKLPWAKKFTCEKNLSIGITAGCQSCRIHQGKNYLQSFEQGWERIWLNCKKNNVGGLALFMLTMRLDCNFWWKKMDGIYML